MSEIYTGKYNAFPFSSFIPFYVNGLGISNDVTTPNSILDVGVGSIVDYTGTYQMVVKSPLTVSSAFAGVGGLDSGTVAASTMYQIYLISDPVSNNPISLLLSTALSAVGPLMPFGYSAYALLGHAATDSSSHFLSGYWSDSDSAYRVFTYDAPQATSVTAGTATTYTGVDLSALVPHFNNVPVMIASSFIPGNAAGDTLKMQGYNSTGDAVIITGQVTTVHVTTNSLVLAQLNTAAPSIKYKVTNAGDTAALNVAGYSWNL
jgi:hypothetical protein